MLGRTNFSSIIPPPFLALHTSTLHCNKVPLLFCQHCGGRQCVHVCVEKWGGGGDTVRDLLCQCKKTSKRVRQHSELQGADGERGRDRRAARPTSTQQPAADPHPTKTTLSPLLSEDARRREAGSHRLKAAISTAAPCHHLMCPNGSRATQRERDVAASLPETTAASSLWLDLL